ncbi:(d)CMP kinase [Gilvimarinus sp. F26214L]|uniref:(d)CMP kinase n=1 Tax=Gilvimarinus sp. DZF01 TaxID=3461371 RepID=UPI0040463151
MQQTLETAPVITIDGPSGSGKGTISQLVARKLGFNFLDSGALYRLTALAARKRNVDWADEAAVARVAAGLDVKFETDGGRATILLDGEDATDAIRKEDMSLGSSTVAAHPAVRAALLELQKGFQRPPGLVADGRDMGTTVFPTADVKIFLTASAEERAQRRYNQLLEKGESVSLRALLKDIQARDERDSQRAVSPLKPADDALILDSTRLSIVEVLDRVLDYAAQRGITPPSE